MAMSRLGNGLFDAKHHEAALSVRETELSMMRRLGDAEERMLVTQGNLANTYEKLGRVEEALRMRQDVYSGRLELNGKEHEETLRAANNYALTLVTLERFEEAKALLRKTLPVVRRVLGENHMLTLLIRWNYAKGLYKNSAAALDDFHEAMETLEDAGRIARRVLGGAHPTTVGIEAALRQARGALAAGALRKGDVESIREAVEAMTPVDA
jgi:tetratricopeptide (TPR) repeat protein